MRTHNSIEFFADPADAPRLIERIRQERFLANVEILFRRPDGREVPVLMNAWIADVQGVRCFEGQFQDIADMGNLTMLGDAVGSDPSVAARLARIKEAVARIRNVVGRLTQITRPEVDTALQDPAERLRLPDQRD